MAVTLFSFHGRTGAGINYTGSGILCFYLFRDEKFLQRKIRGSRFLRFMGYSFRQGWPAHRLHTCLCSCMHTCLCSCKNTAEVPYPVCKPCYDSADYKGFKQFSAMNPVRTIWDEPVLSDMLPIREYLLFHGFLCLSEHSSRTLLLPCLQAKDPKPLSCLPSWLLRPRKVLCWYFYRQFTVPHSEQYRYNLPADLPGKLKPW